MLELYVMEPNVYPVTWDLLPDTCKERTNLEIFENTIKKWKPENCRRRLCKTYINRIGFM